MGNLITIKSVNDGVDNIKIQYIHKQCNTCKCNYINLTRYVGSKELKLIEMLKDDTCPVCSNSKYNLSDMNADAVKLNKIIEQTKNDTPGTKLRFRTITQKFKNWDLLGDIYEEEQNMYGVYVPKTKKFAIKCLDCNFIKLIDAEQYDDIDNIVCNNCKKKLRDKNKEQFNRSMQIVSDEINKLQLAKDNNERAQRIYDEQTSVTIDEKRDSSTISRIKRDLEKANPNLHLLDMFTRDGIEYSRLKCDKCGTLLELTGISKLRDLKKYKCIGCEAQLENPMYRGIFSRKMVGTVINAIRCLEEEDGKLRLECTLCGEELKKYRDKDRFILGKIYCSNPNCFNMEIECPNCHFMSELPIKDINNATSSKSITCKKCGTPIYANALIELDTHNKSKEIEGVLSELLNKSDKPVMLDGIVGRCQKPVYVDNEGRQYYNCRCTEHKQTSILSDYEIKINPHKFCNNAKDIYVSERNLLNLRLNNEKSYIERLVDKESKKKNKET